jgi:hypothetical protein
MLATLLVAFGNAIGDGAHALVHDARHAARLSVAIVGATSSGGKGMSYETIKPFLRSADSEWWENCRKGFSYVYLLDEAAMQW